MRRSSLRVFVVRIWVVKLLLAHCCATLLMSLLSAGLLRITKRLRNLSTHRPLPICDCRATSFTNITPHCSLLILVSDRVQYLLPVGPDRDRIRDNFVQFLDGLDKAKAWEIEVCLFTKPRNDQQNRALWGVAYKELSEQTGNDPADLHTYFCGEHFGWTDYEVMGRRKLKPRRTTTTDENGKRNVMPMPEFAQFYEFIQRRAAQNGFMVSDPDPLIKDAR